MIRESTSSNTAVGAVGGTSSSPGSGRAGVGGRVRRLVASHRSKAPLAVWILLSLIWGSTWLFIKLGLADLPPFTFAGIRFIIAALIIASVVVVRRRPLPRRRADWGLIALTGVLAFSLNYGLLFWGENYISSGLAALLQTIIPVFGLLIGHVHLPQERITSRKAVGILLGIAGVAVIFSDQLSMKGAAALWGSVGIVFGAFCVAYSNVLVKARGAAIDSATLALGQMLFGLVPLLIVGVIFEGNPLKLRWTALAVLSLLYLSLVGSAVAFILFYWLVRNMEVTKTMLIPLVTPIIALTLGMIVLDETLTWRLLFGGLSVMCGIGIIVKRRVEEVRT